MKIVVSCPHFNSSVLEEEREYLRTFADEVIFNPYGRIMTSDEICNMWDGSYAIIAGGSGAEIFDAETIAKAPSTLKIISRFGIGLTNVDLKAATQKGIFVSICPGTTAVSVAESAVGLILDLSRGITYLDKVVRRGGWERPVTPGLFGKSVGIVGLGAVGKEIAIRLKNFGSKIYAYDLYFDEAFAKKHGIIGVNSFEELLSKCDFVSFSVVVSEENTHMLNKETIKHMKDGAFVVNTSRGVIIDEAALIEALNSKKLSGVGLDVFENEPLPMDSPLRKMDNVVLQTHSGGNSEYSIKKTSNISIQNIVELYETGDCRNAVNRMDVKK